VTLDQTLRTLCEKHGLERIDIGLYAEGRPVATIWWGGYGCTFGDGTTCADALANAIEQANARRAITPEVPALEIEA